MNNDYAEEREPLDTKSMLEEGFLKNLPGKVKHKASESVREEHAAQSIVREGSEELLLKAYDIRDNLILSFGQIKLGSSLSRNLTNVINDLGEVVEGLGGHVEKFDPLAHVSGLQAPDLEKNASRVIENTRDSYSLGTIEDAKIDGQSIIIAFAGHTDDMRYRAVGTVTTSAAWVGNEAIDYIHTPGEGKMSIKVFDGGNWVDKSSDYDIIWELFEEPIEKPKNMSLEKPQKKAEKKEGTKEEIQNKLVDDINDDFPIEEVKGD